MEQVPGFETEQEVTEGWQGDWHKGERPPGYRATTERYDSLGELGYSSIEALGRDFVGQYNKLMTKAKDGNLDQAELEEFLEANAKFHESLDEFEVKIKSSKEAT